MEYVNATCKISNSPYRLDWETTAHRAMRMVHLFEMKRIWIAEEAFLNEYPECPIIRTSYRLKEYICHFLVRAAKEYTVNCLSDHPNGLKITHDRLKRICYYLSRIENDMIDVRTSTDRINRELAWYIDFSMSKLGAKPPYCNDHNSPEMALLKQRLKKFL
jgi:hypothetical protein